MSSKMSPGERAPEKFAALGTRACSVPTPRDACPPRSAKRSATFCGVPDCRSLVGHYRRRIVMVFLIVPPVVQNRVARRNALTTDKNRRNQPAGHVLSLATERTTSRPNREPSAFRTRTPRPGTSIVSCFPCGQYLRTQTALVAEMVLCATRRGIIMRLSMVPRSGLRTWIARGETALRAPTRKPGGGTR